VKTIITFLKPYYIHIIIAYTLTFVELVTDLLFPLFLGIIINNGILPGNEQQVIAWGTAMLIITFITFASGIVNSFYASHISVQFAYRLREKLFNDIQRFTFEQLSKFPSSQLVTHFTNDVRQVQNTIFMALRIMARAPFLVLGSVVMALIVNVKIASIFIVTVPLLVLFLFFVLNKGSAMFELVQRKVDDVNRIIQENISGMRTIRSFVRVKFENRRFMQTNRSLAKETTTSFRFVEASMPILFLGMNISILFILAFGHFELSAGQTTVGDVVAIINYALRTAMAISLFTFITLAFSRAKASIERIDRVLQEEEITLQRFDTNISQIDGAITFSNVSFQYENAKKPTLRNVSFHIAARSTTAIIGATGSGKSTLFKLIPRLYELNEGDIHIDGRNLNSYDISFIRNEIGYVPQYSLLFSGTIRDNIAFGKQDATDEEIIQAAKDAQIHATIMQFPQQYETEIGQRGVTLSGGQQQRLSIARALIRQPKILMLDDSTSAIDLQTERQLLQALTAYDCTIVMITQKISTAKRADQIIIIDNGKVVATGSDSHLREHSSLYRHIIESQTEVTVDAI